MAMPTEPGLPGIEPSLEIATTEAEVHIRVGGVLEFEVEVRRSEGWVGAVHLELTGLPRGLTASAGYAFESESRGLVTVRAGTGAPVGRTFEVDLRGTLVGVSGVSATVPLTLLVTGHPGDLDVSFGAAGVTVTQPFDGSYDEVKAIAPIDDGGFVLAGNGYDGSAMVAFVSAYRQDGTAVAGFGAGGTRRFDHPAVSSTALHSVLATDGGILVALREDFALQVIRLGDAGTTDPTFGAGTGAAVRPTERGGLRLIPYGDGFVLAGAADLERYDADGVLVDGFGDHGVLHGTVPTGSGLASFPGGGLVFGWHEDRGDFLFERFDDAGHSLTAFGGTGRVSIPPSASIGNVVSVVALDDGGIVAALSVPPVPDYADPHPVRVIRLTAAGTLDPGFGVEGIAVPTAEAGGTLEAAGMAVAGARVLVWGERWAAGDGAPSGYLSALTLGGDVDASFGDGGTVDLGRRVQPVAAIVTPNRDRILVASNRRAGGGVGAIRDIVVKRLWL